MSKLLKRIIIGFALLLLIGLAIEIWAPSPSTKINLTFNEHLLGEDLDKWLDEKEALVDNLRPNAAKEIIWHEGITDSVTDYSVIYIHGFSASKVETAPVAQNVAKALGANLFLTRLTGHGRDGKAMAEATLSNWANDTAEAISIGSRLGKKVILITGSTGGTLATWAASQSELAGKIHSLVSISPNYGIHGASIGLLNMPWAETLLPLVFGDERSFEPSSEAHAKGWTHTYPSSSVFTMAALLKVVSKINYSKLTVPNFVIYSKKDTVVLSDNTEKVLKRWGGKKGHLVINNSDDPHHHVIAGDILSPSTTDQVTKAILKWIQMLQDS